MLWAFLGPFPVVLCSWRVACCHPPARDMVAPVQRPFAVARMSLLWLSFPKRRSAQGNWDCPEPARDRSLVEPNSDSPCGEMPAAPKSAGIKKIKGTRRMEAAALLPSAWARAAASLLSPCGRPRESGFWETPLLPEDRGREATVPPGAAQEGFAAGEAKGRARGWRLPGAPASASRQSNAAI